MHPSTSATNVLFEGEDMRSMRDQRISGVTGYRNSPISTDSPTASPGTASRIVGRDMILKGRLGILGSR
jgi:hypothetical protein